MSTEVRFTLINGQRHFEVFIDGKTQWAWTQSEAFMTAPSMSVVTALCLNAFALKADAQVAGERLEATYGLLLAMTLEAGRGHRCVAGAG